MLKYTYLLFINNIHMKTKAYLATILLSIITALNLATSEIGNQVADNGNQVADNGNQVADNGNQVADNGNQVADNGNQVA